MRCGPIAAVGAIFALAAAAGASAQTPTDAPADTILRLQADTIPVRVPRPAVTPGGASLARLSLDSLDLPPSPSLAEGIRRLPLVQVRANSRGEAHVALRGARSRQLAVLVDGVPLTVGWDHRTDLSVVPLQGAHELELVLVRGPSSVLHGPNVLGGVVEVAVADAPAASAPDGFVAFALEAADHRSLAVRAGRGKALPNGELVVRGGLGWRSRDRVSLPSGLASLAGGSEARLNSDLRHASGFLALRYRAGSGSWGSLSAFGHRGEKGVPPEMHVADPRLWRVRGAWRTVVALSAGTGWRDTPFGPASLRASVGVDRGEGEILSYESLAYDVVRGGEAYADRTLSTRLVGERLIGEGALRGALTWVRTAHDERVDDGEESRFVQRLWSVGFELEQPLPVERSAGWSLGASLDGADTPETGGREPLGALRAWGMRAGGTFELAEGFLLHGGASHRARFPSLRELYSGALGRFAPNPDLRPERLVVLELGVTTRGRNWELQAVGFRQRLFDAIARTATSDGRLRRVNRHEIRSAGIELLGRAGWRGVTLAGDLTLQRVRQRDRSMAEGGGPAEYQPAIVGSARVVAPLPLDLRAEAGIEYAGRQHCVHPDHAGTISLDPGTWLDAALGRSWPAPGGRRVGATAGVENLTDAAVFDQCGLPRAGRVVRLQLRLH